MFSIFHSLCALLFVSTIVEPIIAKHVPCSIERLNRTVEIDYNKRPIIGIGLPKSGTTSLHAYFQTIHPAIRSGHQQIEDVCSPRLFPIPPIKTDNPNVTWSKVTHIDPAFGRHNRCAFAYYIQKAVADGKKPLEYLIKRGFNAFAQLDQITYEHPRFPQIDLIDTFLDAYPDAFYIHHIRNVSRHVSSIARWGAMAERIRLSGVMNREGRKTDPSQTVEQALADWILWHREYVREKFMQRPGVHYIEVDLEAAEEMASSTISVFVGARCIHHVEQKNHNAGFKYKNH
eukprot:gene37108-45043_t